MISYEVLEQIAILSDEGGYTKELNLISWNGASPKFDIRTWKETDQGKQMYKGVTLTADEMNSLVKAMVQKGA